MSLYNFFQIPDSENVIFVQQGNDSHKHRNEKSQLFFVIYPLSVKLLTFQSANSTTSALEKVEHK